MGQATTFILFAIDYVVDTKQTYEEEGDGEAFKATVDDICKQAQQFANTSDYRIFQRDLDNLAIDNMYEFQEVVHPVIARVIAK